jgi:4-O-beta-D-mannosyl-D-glucose phosphorylase
MHVATSTVDKLLDYVLNTPADPLRSHACVVQRNAMIEKNLEELKTLKLQRAK